MKKKIAVILATVLTISTTIFAASDNSLSSSATIVPNKTLLVESGVYSNAGDIVEDNDDISFIVDGTNLQIELKNTIRAGDTINLSLDNAKWFFRSTENVDTQGSKENILSMIKSPLAAILDELTNIIGSGVLNVDEGKSYALSALKSCQATIMGVLRDTGALNYQDILDKFILVYQDIEAAQSFNDIKDILNTLMLDVGKANYGLYIPNTTALERYTGNFLGGELRQTYDTTKGLWIAIGDAVTTTTGRYLRYGLSNSNIDSVPYALTVQGHSDSVASIEFLEEREAGNIVIVPLVTRTTADGDISVTISNGSISSISNTTHLFGVTASSSTRTYVADPQEARSEFNLDSLVIKELRLASIRNGRVQISAPDGFNFESIGGSLDSAIINVDPGLSWGDGMTGSTPIGGDYADLSYRVDSDGKVDYSTIELTLKDIKTSSRTPGAVYITGLRLVADDDAPFGEIYLRTKNLSYKGKVEKIVSEENHILAGTRVDWKVSLYTEGELPELINGRYEGSQSNADDENHKTAHVIFEENAANAWWAGRETIFTLPKGVKFRKVEITDTENIADGSSLERIFLNDGKINGKVTVDGNVLKLNGISIEKESNPPYDLKKARLEMDIWVSIESGFEGDIALSLDGSSVSGAEIPTDIVIATQITPITVLTTTSDVKIGYQYYQTGDFEIKEVMPGALLKNRQVRISVSDRISQDMFFTPDFTCEVLESNIKISKPTISYGGSANTNLGDDVGKSSMFFNIERSSTDTGATIKFSNVFVKIDRSVPETSTPYELIVWGSAIANNYNNTSDAELDNFATPGIKVPYVSVVTAASDKPGLFTQAVSLTIGERVYTVNDNTFEMDAEPYISLESNSTMVPIRFIANAFGFKDEQIIWDDASRTVSIIESTGKIVQFTAGSDKMVINGASITIQSPDHLPVKSEIKNDRMYISFRALGDVFAVPVYWDSSTQTAYYNYNANDKVVIEDSEISEAERLSSDDTDNSEIYESIEGDTQYEYEVA